MPDAVVGLDLVGVRDQYRREAHAAATPPSGTRIARDAPLGASPLQPVDVQDTRRRNSRSSSSTGALAALHRTTSRGPRVRTRCKADSERVYDGVEVLAADRRERDEADPPPRADLRGVVRAAVDRRGDPPADQLQRESLRERLEAAVVGWDPPRAQDRHPVPRAIARTGRACAPAPGRHARDPQQGHAVQHRDAGHPLLEIAELGSDEHIDPHARQDGRSRRPVGAPGGRTRPSSREAMTRSTTALGGRSVGRISVTRNGAPGARVRSSRSRRAAASSPRTAYRSRPSPSGTRARRKRRNSSRVMTEDRSSPRTTRPIQARERSPDSSRVFPSRSATPHDTAVENAASRFDVPGRRAPLRYSPRARATAT